MSGMQVPEVNYNCRLRDINSACNAGSQNRDDADVGLLVACKVQLSSEVIRWKTESLRLQKERDSAQHRSQELDQTVSKLLERTKDLEARLVMAEEENKHLKTRSVLVDNEKVKLSQNLNKYSSLHASVGVPKLARYGENKSGVEPVEDWRDVSQKMLQQMQQEMKELREMDLQLSRSESGCEETDNMDSDCREELERSISALTNDAKSIKHHLLDQRRKLHLLFQNFSQGDFCPKESICVGKRNIDFPIVGNQTTVEDSAQQTFHNYLLEGLPNLSQIDVNTLHLDEDLTLHPESCNKDSSYEEQRVVVEDRVCPICQEPFGVTVPQADFEEHVFNHLETESASLLEQYVVL